MTNTVINHTDHRTITLKSKTRKDPKLKFGDHVRISRY